MSYNIALLHAPSPRYLLDLRLTLHESNGASVDELFKLGATATSLIARVLADYGILHKFTCFDDRLGEYAPDILVVDLSIVSEHHYRVLEWATASSRCRILLLCPTGAEIGFNFVIKQYVARFGLHTYLTAHDLRGIFNRMIRLHLVADLPH